MADVENRESIERKLTALILILWGSEDFAFWSGAQPSIRCFADQVSENGITEIATELARDQTRSFLDEIDWRLDRDRVARGSEWIGERYERDLAKRLAESHRQWQDRRDIAERDGDHIPTFDEIYLDWQGEREGATSVTTIASQTEMRARNRIKNIYDVDLVGYWRLDYTSNFCQQCVGLSQTPDWVWAIQFPEGPPAHPNCRCGIQWERSYLTT